MKKYLSGFKFFEARVHRMALLSTFSIGLILFLLGVVSLGLLVANRFLSVNVGEITLKISIQDNLAPAIQQKIQSDLSSWQCSKGVKFVSKDAALAEYIAETGDKEIIALMGGINPLLASFHVQIASPCILSDSIEHLKHRIQSNIGVASVDYPLEMIQSLESNTARISWITGLLTIVALS
jgi:cell division protein FtsX